MPAREADLLRAVLAVLQLHLTVAWVHRMNVVAHKIGGPGRERFVGGARGMADITGQLFDGPRLEIETKAANGRLSDDRRAFLKLVRENIGVALVVRDVRELVAALDAIAVEP